MIKRISLLMVAALMVVMMLAATAAPAFAVSPAEEECDGTYERKTCSEPVGNSGKVKTYTNDNNGSQAEVVERTNPNGKVIGGGD